MIYLLSDLHCGENIKGFFEFLEKSNPEDTLILLGDIGLRFEDTEQCREFEQYFLSANRQVAFIDGNHENFDFLETFPVESWNGGMVHRLSENVVHLMRGEIFKIDGKSFFAFGGCISSAKWKDLGQWYPQERATEEELSRAYENLKNYNYKVDYILTHKTEFHGVRGTNYPEYLEINKFLFDKVEYKCWYAGHWHESRVIDEKHILVYDELLTLE